MEVYTPESPRASTLTTSGFLRPGIFGKKKAVIPDGPVPEYLKNMLYKNQFSKPAKTFVLVARWKEYLKDLERTGTSDQIVGRLRTFHEKWNPIETVEVAVTYHEVPDHADAVVVNLTTTKAGKVKVYIGAPLDDITNQYLSKGTRAPINEYLKALKRFGYPEEVLLKVLEKHQTREAKSDELDAFIERIFGKSSNKTASKPKARSARDQLMSIMKIRKSA